MRIKPTTQVLPWGLDRFDKGYFIRRQNAPVDMESGVRSPCINLTTSEELIKSVVRAKEETAKPNTPWIYLNYYQLKNLLKVSRKKNSELELRVITILLNASFSELI